MSHLAGASREQQGRFPEGLDDYIAEENPGRFIEACVESRDLDALGFRRAQPAATGRPAYPPGDFLTRYMYGDLHRLRSSRRLEQETPRNVELLWLLRKLPSAFNTIADVRKANVPAFKQVFRAFTVRGKEWGLFGPARGASDGSKFTAVTSKRRHVTQAKRHETRPAIDAKLAPYRRDLDATADAEAEGPPPPADTRREKIRHLRARTGR
jgi:transposase